MHLDLFKPDTLYYIIQILTYIELKLAATGALFDVI